MTREEAYDIVRAALVKNSIAWPGVDDALDVLLNTSPAICGAAEAGEMLGMAATNIKRLSPPLVPVARLKMGPVFLISDVLAAKARREG